ncbi:MAG: gamma-glutamyl-gamma-aminobutyrate hydrolase family protein [Rhodomicrobium sp.]|nr:gamma-glutamyl-gamma-aminobutyrate hydrolase family protein [Rhodomicrobium sp.]
MGVTSDRAADDGVPVDTVRIRYLEALRETAGVVPVILPAGLGDSEAAAIAQRLDGILLTGAPSNVSPARYGNASKTGLQLDPYRDETAFAIIRMAVRYKLPIFGICRGLQELNVAFGGTLHQEIADVPGFETHREDTSLPRDQQYFPVHPISLEGEGIIASTLRGKNLDPLVVNSLHGQGIDRLGIDLAVDARSRDGVIEAVSLRRPSSFAAAVQWHPEWYHATDPVSLALLRAFGDACREHLRRKSSTL